MAIFMKHPQQALIQPGKSIAKGKNGMSLNPPLNRKLRMGLVGGGGGFIGRVHALSAMLDHRALLVAGALSSDPVKARALAPDFDIPPERAYGSYQEMLAGEGALPLEERIDFVSIATPNHTHFQIASAFAQAGFNVMCDKPMTFDVAQAEELTRIVERAGVVFALTHNYTGYPLVRQARDMVRAGELGEINAVRTRYLQASLYRRRNPEQERRFAWKTDPERAGISGAFGDIGTHAYNLVRFITGLVPAQISCLLRTYHPGSRLDDYGTAVLRFPNGALGTITASRVSHGRENDLAIEIDGTQGSLEWQQEEPNKMWLKVNGRPHRLFTRDPNVSHTTLTARSSCRLPAGHPEGFLQAFANVYTAAYEDMSARAAGQQWERSQTLYPNVVDGADCMNFVTRCVESSKRGGEWRAL
jgi:predicted dehydrogenase